MDSQMQEFSKRLARAQPRRGFVGSLGRMAVGASALGLALTGLPRPLAALAAAGPPTPRPKGFPPLPPPIPFDPRHLHDGQEVLPPGAAKAATPHYVTCTDGCNCPGNWNNPCPNCCGSSSGPYGNRYWNRCTSYQCCCNPCPDTCCSLGRAMTFEYQFNDWSCCDGSGATVQFATGNFGCDIYGTCSPGEPCYIPNTCCS